MESMRVIPVLDVMQGLVVRGVGGRRHEYKPISSTIVSSSEPLAVARAIRDHFGLSEFYFADLDAIGGAEPLVDTYLALQTDGFTLMVDAGLRTAAHAAPLEKAGIARIVAGLETLAGHEELKVLVRNLGSSRVVFSLDLKEGKPLTSSSGWGSNDPYDVAVKALEHGVKRLLTLDLSRVGSDMGTNTGELCSRLRRGHRELEILTGGGVRGRDDLRRLEQCGVDAVLVSSALHDGRLQRDDLR